MSEKEDPNKQHNVISQESKIKTNPKISTRKN
jgi:hypothetical protein